MPPPHPLSLLVEIRTQSLVGGRCRLLACSSYRHASRWLFTPRPVLRLVPRPGLLACLVPPLRFSSSHPFPTGLAACLIRSSLIVSSSRLLLRIACLPVSSDKRGGEGTRSAEGVSSGGGRRAGYRCGAAAACLPRMADRYRRRMAAGGVSACLSRGDGRGGSVISSLSSHRLIPSARFPGYRLIPSLIISSTGRGFLFLFA